MAGLLAWAADVVGGGDDSDVDRPSSAVPVVLSQEQQRRADELDRKAADLRRSIHDLRLRIPPPHVSQRLPHLHAHSVASNQALALQLNAHSTTREQAQQREVSLQEENNAYEKAISNCKRKIHEKQSEAEILQSKLKEMDAIEKELKEKLERSIKMEEIGQSETPTKTVSDSTENEMEASRSVKLKELEEKKKELRLMEETVERLEKDCSLVQQESEKKPSPAQREKQLEKQLHSLIEQLTAKQAQAESLITDIHAKQKELESLNILQRNLDTGINEANTTRNRFGRGFTVSGVMESSSYDEFKSNRRNMNLQRLMILRSAFVIYILALHIIVFIRISFY